MDTVHGSMIVTIVYYLVCAYVAVFLIPRWVHRIENSGLMVITGLACITALTVLTFGIPLGLWEPFMAMAALAAGILGASRILSMYFRRFQKVS